MFDRYAFINFALGALEAACWLVCAAVAYTLIRVVWAPYLPVIPFYDQLQTP